MVNKTERNTEIDVLRGIGIVSVVWYHFGFEGMLSQYIASFHMILFFCISGYFYKQRQFSNDPADFVKRKSKSFLTPYFLWIFIFTILNIVLDYFSNNEFVTKRYFLNVLTSNLSFGAIWFLTAIFITSILGAMIIDYINKSIFMIAFSVFFAIVGYCGSFINIPSIFRWEQALASIPAFVMGYLFGKHNNNNSTISHNISYYALLFLLFGALGFGGSKLNGIAILSRMMFGRSFLLFYLCSILSVLAWFYLARFMVRLNLKPLISGLAYYGRNSLVILITHQVLILIVNHIAHLFCDGIIADLLGFIIILIIEIPICRICKMNWCKWIFGLKR